MTPEITNAKTDAAPPPIFLMVGLAGSGKTTQFLTFPRPALAIFFDPNGRAALRGHDIDTVYFPADGVSLELRSGKKKEGAQYGEPTTYHSFMMWYNKMLSEDGFAKYKSIMLDSASTLELAITDGVLADRNLTHSIPDTDEYIMVVRTMMNVFRQLIAGGKWTLVTAHQMDKTNRADQVIGIDLAVTGKLRRDLPSLFTDVYFTSCKGDSQKISFLGQTRPGGHIQKAKNSFQNTLPFSYDLSIKDFAHPEKYGLGELITRFEKENQ